MGRIACRFGRTEGRDDRPPPRSLPLWAGKSAFPYAAPTRTPTDPADKTDGDLDLLQYKL